MMELTLADIMNRQVRHVLPECTLGDAARQMNDARMSSLLVMSDSTPLGIITERDLLRHLSCHTSRQTLVSEIMSHPVLTAAPDTGFTAAYSQVLNHHVRHLVVVDSKGGVIGLASETDFRNHLGSDLLRKLDDLQSVMDHKLPQFRPEDMLSDAVAMMLRDHTSYALVVENGLPVGILTERDMAGLFVDGIPVEGLTLREVMHSPVLTVSHQTPVFEMAGLMQARRYRHLVVVDDAGHVLGMVTLHKLMERIAATVMNEETLRRQESLEYSMHHAESQLRMIVKTIPDLIWLKDVEGVYLSCNPMFERFFGATEADIVGKTDYDFVSREQVDFFRAHDRAAMLADKPSINEEWVTFADDGHRACLETTKSPMFNAVGQLIGVLGIAHDITERLAAAQKIERLTQLYNALSQCNQSIVHSNSEAELFAQICHDAVQFGGFKMAWVGVADRETGWIRPVASYGDGVEYLQGLKMSVDASNPLGRGPTGTVIRENRPVWCQDYQNDPDTAPWHQIGASYGWGASAALPLCRNGVAVGAFGLYAAQVNGFDEESRHLLTEMAMDISFAMDNFERKDARKRLELQIESERFVLELLARGESLPVLLKQLVLSFEVIYPGMFCSVLLLSNDGKYLIHGASGSLPDAYCDAINGVLIGEQVGSCGTAAFTRKTTVVSDIKNDPLWRDFQSLALAHDLASCWSVPILSTKGQVLGTFALYYSKPRSPLADELAAQERGAHLASLAIERAQTGAWLSKLSQAVEQSPNSIVITDLKGNIEYANDAFVKATGYSLAEVMGKNPRILHSGKTSVETYEEMWTQLNSGQMWRGELINRRKDGSEYVEMARISPLRHTDGQVTNYLSIKEDITEQKQVEARIRQLAHFDTLTGLPNQTLLKDRAGFAMQIAQRSAHHLAVLFLDIDHFKNINDTLGHRIGDELLVHLAKRMKLLLREEDTLSRFGGDEFILVLPDTDADGAARVAEKILVTVAKACCIEQHELVVT
ncbi:MAG: CBS domain-containing protein, partial [Nitrosomonadales bacterium]